MDSHTCLEDLSNEIFFEIFDYLHALDIFTAFTSLNKRISSILRIIPLRVIISDDHRRHHVDCLSSHLTFHAHQVISVDIFDKILDDSSIVSLFFNQHKFINLQSCSFISVNPSTKLENVFKQIKSLNRLVSISVIQPKYENLNKNTKNDLLQTIFTHNSSHLRSIALGLPYDYLDISKCTSIPSNLKSLYLTISSSILNISVYSILPIFRLCHSIQNLSIILTGSLLFEENNNVSNQALTVNDETLPVLLQIMSFEIRILGSCDGRAIYSMLRCMPSLKYFYFILSRKNSNWAFPGELVDGLVWKRMLELYVPSLSKFEFHMLIATQILGSNLHTIVNSFVCCVRKYSNWHMIIDRWKSYTQIEEEFIMLRTLNYDKHKSKCTIYIPVITTRSFETLSTTTDDHHLFYPLIYELNICITKKRPMITWSSPLYQEVINLIIEISPRSSIWNSLLNIVSSNDDNDAQKYVTCLSQFVYLPSVFHLEFGSTFDISRWKEIQFILQACPKVADLIIDTRLLILSKLIDNPSLISFFKQIKMLQSKTKNIYFPSNFSSKLVQRFPSLNHVELQVFSFDHCVPIIDVFISHLKELSYMKINYLQDTLLDDPFSCDYILAKRSEIFPDIRFNAELIKVKNSGDAIEIWLP